MMVPVQSGATLQVGDARLLFEGQYFYNPALRSYDVSPDGQRFLRVKQTPGRRSASTDYGTGSGAQAILVKNWFEELKRLVPTE